MKFKTYQFTKLWVDTQAATGDPLAMEEAKRAKQQIENLLSSVLLSENLVILTGLGTSPCIKDTAGNRVAPTMQDLWSLAKKSTKDFDAILTKVRQPMEASGRWTEDIETLLSRCQMSIEIEGDASISNFIAATENMIATSCAFLGRLPAGRS